MGIPIRSVGITLPDDGYPDEILIYAAASGADFEGSPLGAPGADGSRLRCQVQDASTGRPTQLQDGEAPFGLYESVILMKTDPGPVVAHQQIAWVSHDGIDHATPLYFAANGAAQPPGSHDPGNYRISAGRRI